MADRKMTVLNPAGYQEILQTDDELIVDSNTAQFSANTEVGFFGVTPIARQAAADQSLTQVIEEMRKALNAFGLTNITTNGNYTQDLADLLDYLNNPVDLTPDSPIVISETDNNYTIGLKEDFLIGTSPINASAQDASGDYTISVDAATTTSVGVVELAILSELITGTDATRAVTPDALHHALDEEGAVIGTDTDGDDAADDGYTIDCGIYYTDP